MLTLPNVHDALAWLTYLHRLPQKIAVVVLIISLSMLIFGVRFERYYACLGASVLGWFAGIAVSKVMYVKAWYAALPVAVLSAVSMWQVSGLVISALIGLIFGGVTAWIAYKVHGSPLALWLSGGAGFLLGWTVRSAMPRLMTALLFGAVGIVHGIAVLGAAVHSRSGWLAPGAYRDTPVPFVIGGAVLLLVSCVVQLKMAPASSGNAK